MTGVGISGTKAGSERLTSSASLFLVLSNFRIQLYTGLGEGILDTANVRQKSLKMLGGTSLGRVTEDRGRIMSPSWRAGWHHLDPAAGTALSFRRHYPGQLFSPWVSCLLPLPSIALGCPCFYEKGSAPQFCIPVKNMVYFKTWITSLRPFGSSLQS